MAEDDDELRARLDETEARMTNILALAMDLEHRERREEDAYSIGGVAAVALITTEGDAEAAIVWLEGMRAEAPGDIITDAQSAIRRAANSLA